MKQYLYLLLIVFFNSVVVLTLAETLEDIKKETGWQPRIHSEKIDSSGFNILRIDRDIEKSYWKGMRYQVVKVTWKSPQVDDVALRLYILLGKGNERSIVLVEGIFDTTKGVHECGTEISEFIIKRLGSIKDCYAELWYRDKLVARKQSLAKYSPSGFDRSKHWWKNREIAESLNFYWTDPGLK